VFNLLCHRRTQQRQHAEHADRKVHLRRLAAAARSEDSGVAAAVVAAPFILLLGPVGLVMAFRAFGEGCLRMGGASLALGGWFLLSGLVLAVPKAFGRWGVGLWLACLVAFILFAATGPLPISCPAWTR
jgi:hypothetical protein